MLTIVLPPSPSPPTTPTPTRRDSQANHLNQSLHPRYFNIGYGNKLRIDLEAYVSTRVPRARALPPLSMQPFTSTRHENSLLSFSPVAYSVLVLVHVNRRDHIITLNDTRYETCYIGIARDTRMIRDVFRGPQKTRVVSCKLR